MASRSLNQASLIGNLTRDPELRYTPQGTAVCQFGLATNRDWVTAQGEKKEEVQYHRIVAWSKLAELCGQLLVKGTKIYLQGRIVYRSFEGKDGTQKSLTEIVMDNMIILSSKGAPAAMASASHEEEGQGVPQETVSKKKPAKKEAVSETPTVEEPMAENINDDEIPF